MPNRLGEPWQVSRSDEIPIWFIGLSDDPRPEWRLQFLCAAHTSGIFHDGRIKVEAAAILFEIEPSALSLACEKIDHWIAEANDAPSSSTPERPAELPVPAATIMVVDDQVEIGRLARDILEPAGYSVMLMSDPFEAIRLARHHARTVDLLLTDVVMPLMDGRDLARRLLVLRPKLKVILMSGYEVSGLAETGWAFLAKPFGLAAVTQLVAEVLKKRPQGIE